MYSDFHMWSLKGLRRTVSRDVWQSLGLDWDRIVNKKWKCRGPQYMGVGGGAII